MGSLALTLVVLLGCTWRVHYSLGRKLDWDCLCCPQSGGEAEMPPPLDTDGIAVSALESV